MRWAIALACVGCWRGSPPAPPPPPPAEAPPDASPDPEPIGPPTEVIAPPDPAQCPSGTGIAARIIGIEIRGSDTIVLTAGGSSAGITMSWTPLSRHPCSILRVDHQRTILACQGTPDQIKAVTFVLLCAP